VTETDAALPYLESSGWLRSRELKMPVDAEARPLPWYTYAAIDFLTRRSRPDMHVLEFGSGNSTRWWAERVATVVTVEHDEEWAARVARDLPSNVSLMRVPLEPDGEYCRSALHAREKFHVIVIDGRDRVNCAKNCLGSLRHDGVIVWDDSQRSRYRPGYRYLARRDFRRLEFTGLGAMAPVNKETSVFYRDGNCLGI
jgi:predicted O-methyltransferase YrrM